MESNYTAISSNLFLLLALMLGISCLFFLTGNTLLFAFGIKSGKQCLYGDKLIEFPPSFEASFKSVNTSYCCQYFTLSSFLTGPGGLSSDFIMPTLLFRDAFEKSILRNLADILCLICYWVFLLASLLLHSSSPPYFE